MRRTLLLLASVLPIAACSGTSTSTLTSPAATRCRIAASSNPSIFTSMGGTGSITVNTTRDCTWSVTAAAEWIEVRDPVEGQGEGRVTYSVAPNDQMQERRGTIDVGGFRVELRQAPAPNPPPAPVPDSGPPTSPPAPNPGPGPGPGPAPNPPPGPSPVPAPNPPPAPTPSPAPNPPPAPIPEPRGTGKPVEVNGTISSLSGSCPLVRMIVSDTTVLTNSGTEFKKVSCDTLHDGMKVEVKGPRTTDGWIVAQKIERD